MSSLLNPYIAGAPVVEPSMFFGRHDVFQWIEHSLEGKFVNHILVIHGQRRVGKTSVLKQIPNFLPKNYIQVFFDLQGRTSTTLDRFLWWQAREISRVLKQEHGLVVPVPDREAFTSDPEILLTQFLPGLLSLLGERRLLLTFDEFDTLEQPEVRDTLARALIQYLRRMFELPNLSFIFSIGSSGHKLENMQASYTDFFKTALYRKISFLGRDDCFQLITRPVSEMLEYEPKARQRIYEVTGGHPYFTQLVCHELFSLCQKTGRRSLSAEDVDGILDDVIERGTVNLKFTWDEASSLEKWLMACLAQPPSGSPLEGGRVQAALKDMLHAQRVRYSEPDLNAALIHLRDKDVLGEDNRFVIYLLQRWLRKNRPLDRVREELVEVNPIANRYIEIGEEFRSLGQAARALESFQQALAVDPQNLKAQAGIAHVHLEQGDHLAAMHAFEQALSLDDEDVASRSGLCDACLALGEAASQALDWDTARDYYRRILAVNPEHAGARQRLAQVYCWQAEAALRSQQDERAMRFYGDALQVTPEDETLSQRIRQLHGLMTEKAISALLAETQGAAAAGQWGKAIGRLREGLQIFPGEPRLEQALAGILADQRQAKLAALRKQAERLGAAEQWAGALQAWQEYLALEPDDADQVQEEVQRLETQRSLAEAYTQAQKALDDKDFSRAASLLKKVILVDENYRDGARLLATAIEGKRQRKPALRLPRLHLSRRAGVTLAGVLLLAGLVFVGVKLASFVEMQNIASLPTSVATDTLPTMAPTAAVDPRIAYLLETQEPQFSDDFSAWNTTWGEPQPGALDVWAEGGQMVLTPPEGESAILESDAINAYHFALQYTLFFDIPEGLQEADKFAVFMHNFRAYPETEGYTLYVELNGAADNRSTEADLYNWKVVGGPSDLSGTTSLLHHGEANLITVAYLGDECVIWVNHQVLAHFFDQQHNGTLNRLGARTDQGTLKVVIDDLKFWNLEEEGEAGMPTPAPTDSSAALPTMENSVTPNPRSTADLPWVADFATPLMESARSTAPTFQDSFDYLRADWQTAGNVTIQPDGAVFATDPDLEPPTLRGSPLSAREFVLQFDMRAEYSPAVGEGSESMLALNLIISDDEWYALYIVLNDAPAESAAHAWSVYQFPENILLVQGMTPAFDATGWTRLEVLFSDNHMGLLINDQPVTYFGAPASGNLTKDITLGAIAKTEAMTLLIDNLKLWDLEHLSASINPEPDLAFLAYRMPEITDEFNLIDPQWQIDAGATGVDNGQLLLVTNSDGYVRMQHPALNAMDFMVSFDFQVLSQGSDLAVMSLEYRITNQTRYIFSLSYELEQVRWYLSYNEANDVNTELASGLLPGFDIAAVHQVKAGASGCQLWVTLDDSLLTYIPTNRLSEGQINLVMKSNSRTASYALDSFRYWNLDQQPVVLGFGSDEEHDFIRPILRTSESADYAEYFASVPGDWQISASESDEFTAMGMAILSISGGGSIELQPPLATPADFGLQFDLALGELSGDTEMFVEFGSSAATYTLSFTPHSHSLRLELGGDLLAEIQNPWVAPGGWLRVLLVVQADRIGVYLNGEPQLFLNVSADPSGEVRLRFDSAAEAAFLLDTFLLWDLTATP